MSSCRGGCGGGGRRCCCPCAPEHRDVAGRRGAPSEPSSSCGASGSVTSSEGRRCDAPKRTAADRPSCAGNRLLPCHHQGGEGVREVRVPREDPRGEPVPAAPSPRTLLPVHLLVRLAPVVARRQDRPHAHLPGSIVEAVTDL